jgi:hypothetical protein
MRIFNLTNWFLQNQDKKYILKIIKDKKKSSLYFGFVFLLANVIGAYLEWKNKNWIQFFLDLGMLFCNIIMILSVFNSIKLKNRFIYILFLFIAVLLECETQDHDPIGPFDDPRVSFGNLLILFLTAFSFPGFPLHFTIFWTLYFIFFYFRFSIFTLQSFDHPRMLILLTQYIPSIIFCCLLNKWWIGLKVKLLKQNHKIIILEKQFRVKERTEIFQDIHDYLSSGLTDLMLLFNELKPNIKLKLSKIEQIQRTLYSTISKLNSRLNVHDELKWLHDDFIMGLKMILVRRYQFSKRKLRLECSDYTLLKVNNEIHHSKIVEILPLISEIATNDLKFGIGDIFWKIDCDDTNLMLSYETGSNFDKNKKCGIGTNSIKKHVYNLGGFMVEDLENGRYNLKLKIPFYTNNP